MIYKIQLKEYVLHLTGSDVIKTENSTKSAVSFDVIVSNILEHGLDIPTDKIDAEMPKLIKQINSSKQGFWYCESTGKFKKPKASNSNIKAIFFKITPETSAEVKANQDPALYVLSRDQSDAKWKSLIASWNDKAMMHLPPWLTVELTRLKYPNKW